MPEVLKIDSIAYRGAGVSRLNGCVYFTPNTCQGETVEADVVRKHKTFVEASVVSIIDPSADRLEQPECVTRDTYGNPIPVPGCVYGHVKYSGEIQYKQSQLISFLTRQAKIPNASEIILSPTVSPKHLSYRNKTTLHIERTTHGEILIGYIGDNNVTVVDIAECPLSIPDINEALRKLRDNKTILEKNIGGSITLRWTPQNGVVIIPDNLKSKDLPSLQEELSIGVLDVPARGFFQINPEVSRLLIEYVAELTKEFKPDALIDFYCGVGIFALTIAEQNNIPHIIGVDTGDDVIDAANRNAKKLSLNAKFKNAMAGRVAKDILREISTCKSTVILDPPRSGLEPEMVAALLKYPPTQIIYVSCAPDTLARDIALLKQNGTFSVASAKLFDMFPRTAHFESVVCLN